jgi:hypothetical protein
VDNDETTHTPTSNVPIKFSKTYKINLKSQRTARQERDNSILTCNSRNRPNILRSEHLLQYRCHKGELHDASQRSNHEGRAKVQLKHLGDHRIKHDKGEAETDVGPVKVRDWVFWERVHVGRSACDTSFFFLLLPLIGVR